MNLRLLPLIISLLFAAPLYAQETPIKPENQTDLIAKWRGPALFGLGFSAAQVGIFGSTFKPYQGKGIAVMRAAVAFTKFGLGILLLTCQDKIVQQIDLWKKAYPLPNSEDEQEYLKRRRGL
jgi:hypothetical protein